MRYKEHKQYRLPNRSYSEDGDYFITICTKNREEFFGQVVNSKMELSPIGEIANNFWLKIPKKFPNAILDEFIIMPDHIHGIITLKNKLINDNYAGTHQNYSKDILSSNNSNNDVQNKSLKRVPRGNLHPLIKNSISSIINHYKGSVKTSCKYKRILNFNWQLRFYDRIIRNDREFYFVQEYIKNNPENWGKEEFDEEEYLDGVFAKFEDQ